ncbi:MAG: ATP-binding protein [Candidatus Methanoperedens sp.]|nr:ATP-binding protein [Candidatus Methanoperedens sp.]MCZ7405887.1 ATP-binding protein [Candidatus Methanoperedens sp.]
MEIFEEWNTYARKKALKPRAVDLKGIETNSKLKIIGITGIRRSGKSSILILLLQMLDKDGKKGAYINVEDSRIKNSPDALDNILKWFGDSGYLLLDEITSAEDWEGWLARNHELLKGKLYLIVSSSRRNLVVPSKPLRGRMLSYEVYPLSFKEFLQFKNISIEYTTAGIGLIEKALDEYLLYGGFPEVVLTEDMTDKIKLLDSYFRDIIGLDVAEIADESIAVVQVFGKYIIEAPYFSASKCLNFFKGLGFKIGKQSILYLEKCSQDGYLFYFLPILSYTIKDRLQYPRKAYLGDTGFAYAISGKKDMGRLYENAVFLELKRRLAPQMSLCYWKSREGFEVDFAISEGLKTKEIIQVAYSLENKKTLYRELRGMALCARELGAENCLVITKEHEGTERFEEMEVRFIPLWKWLVRE